jgi:methionyl-tRNA formyltransferase
MGLRILFAGTPDIAVPCLEVLSEHHTVVAVLTNPDRISGRGRRITESPVKRAAARLEIPVIQPERLGSAARSEVRRYSPELLVVFAYGRIFGPKFMAIFPRGGVNVHPSLLPKHRGPAPIPAAILSGDEKTGITVQTLAPEMDAGDVVRQVEIPLRGDETTGALTETVRQRSPRVLLTAVDDIAAGKDEFVPQDHEKATYCSLITKGDGSIDFSRGAADIERMVRAYDPWPKAFTSLGEKLLFILRSDVYIDRPPDTGLHQESPGPGEVVGVDKDSGILIQTGNGLLAVTRVQLESKKPLDWDVFMHGTPDLVGRILGRSR